jgi:dTDP-glucose pyrophosphorylase
VDRRHLKTLAWMMAGLIQAGKISLTGWVPYVHSRAVYTQSTVRRFARWLENPMCCTPEQLVKTRRTSAMKALITVGGRGTRLRPLTHTRHKHLMPMANKPTIHYAIEAVAVAGIREIGISINPDTGADLQAALGNGEARGVRLSYIVREAPLGLAHVLRVAESFLRGERFVFYLGDNLIVGGITRFVERFAPNSDDCHLVLAHVHDPQRFVVAELCDGCVVRVEEKPSHPTSDLAVTGIYCYTPAIFEAAHAIRPSARGELEISDAHQYLIEHGRQVSFSEATGWWKDTGKPEDLLEANRVVLDILVFTEYDNPAYALIALAAGALGYLCKRAPTADLLMAIRSVYEGCYFVDPMLATPLLQDFLHQRMITRRQP